MADKKKKTGFALAFWLLVALVLLIIFLVKKDDIFTNLKRTGFMDKVFGTTPEFVQNYQEKESKSGKNAESNEEPLVIEITPKTTKTETPKVEKTETPKTEAPKTEEKKEESKPAKVVLPDEEKPATAKPIVEEKKEEVKPVVNETPAEKPKAKSNLSLCFISIAPDGSINPKVITRSVNKSDSPLTEAIRLIIAGPDKMASAEKDLMSLIPKGSKLIGASVKDGVATLNFNDEFAINTDGEEGFKAQLMQVVYTATSFSTVKSVQFLIEGEKVDFLGQGHWVGTPLTRNSSF
ncbi:MAG: GerMN domain-containing protein [Treponema sp.]|nr:GerMN domain-containing protein [Treponema sp.]